MVCDNGPSRALHIPDPSITGSQVRSRWWNLRLAGPMKNAGVRRIRAILKWSGEHDFPSGCPLWTALSLEASRHDGVAAVLLDAPPSQQRASMLLAAVHDLVLAGVEHPLRSYFPTMSRDPRPVDDRLASVFVDFVERYESELRHLVGSRTVQTNEVGTRCRGATGGRSRMC